MMKVVLSRQQIAQKMGSWALDFQPRQLTLLGIAEVMGALGIVLPYLTGLLPVLTPAAALGMIAILIGAIHTHIQRNEYLNVIMNTGFVFMAALVAYGRF